MLSNKEIADVSKQELALLAKDRARKIKCRAGPR